MINIKVEINKINSRKVIDNIDEIKSCFFKNTNTDNIYLFRFTNKTDSRLK